MIRDVREGPVLVLVVNVAPEANLTKVICRASKAICPAHVASAKFVALVVFRCHCRLRDEGFTHAAEPRFCDAHESPEAEATRLSLLRRVLGGWLLVLCVFEAGRLAHVRMVVDVAEPDIVREVLGVPLGVCFKLVRRGNHSLSPQRPRCTRCKGPPPNRASSITSTRRAEYPK